MEKQPKKILKLQLKKQSITRLNANQLFKILGGGGVASAGCQGGGAGGGGGNNGGTRPPSGDNCG